MKGSDTVQCTYINDKRIKIKDLLVTFCSFLKLRGMSSAAGHVVTLRRAGCPGSLELQRM